MYSISEWSIVQIFNKIRTIKPFKIFFLPQALPRSLVPENLITQVQILSRESVPKGSPMDIEQRVNLKGSWWKMLSKWSIYNIFEERLWVMTSYFYQSLVALRTCFKDKMMGISWRWQSRAFSKHFISYHRFVLQIEFLKDQRNEKISRGLRSPPTGPDQRPGWGPGGKAQEAYLSFENLLL